MHDSEILEMIERGVYSGIYEIELHKFINDKDYAKIVGAYNAFLMVTCVEYILMKVIPDYSDSDMIYDTYLKRVPFITHDIYEECITVAYNNMVPIDQLRSVIYAIPYIFRSVIEDHERLAEHKEAISKEFKEYIKVLNLDINPAEVYYEREVQ